jgi:carbonic anhydrase/acetyltransferase-like protein (isoleucine patch superfamily)
MPIYVFERKHPRIHPTVYVAQNASVIGDTVIGEGSSVWPCAVIRGDIGLITIGKYTSIQDNVVIHGSVKIGDYVRVGHGVVIHGAIIENNSLIGINSVILDHAKIQKNSVIGAGSLVLENTVIPANSLVVGSPSKVIRSLNASEQEARARKRAEAYFQLAQKHKQSS